MFLAERIRYQDTNAFGKIVTAYLNRSKELQPFYAHPPDLEGIRQAIMQRKQFHTNREVLVKQLQQQYESIGAPPLVKENIQALLSANTFTVTTAHQPNLFTGPLYFIYKIMHAIRLAVFLGDELPGYKFVPVYYMGSEDADFAELNHTYVNGKKIEWEKGQTGAVGRMKVDQTLVQLIDEIEGQLGVEAHGSEVIGLLKKCYASGEDIQSATFRIVSQLYGRYGLVVLIPDNALLKSQMQQVFEDDLFRNTSADIVEQTSKKLEAHFEVQAHPREINLFYLKDQLRERIIYEEGAFRINNTGIRFTETAMREELRQHPERFSPNVILRGLYQETILPNIAFVGGGGELAYWLQLKELFDHYRVPYPVLVLRNSFLIIEKKWKGKIDRLRLKPAELFRPESEILKLIVQRHSEQKTSLNGNFEKAQDLFDEISRQATEIDPTLAQYVAAIKTRSLNSLQELEKKMLRAEKRKFADEENQVKKIRAALFPNDKLQERVENFSGFYARWGSSFIEALYENSLALEQEFSVLVEQPGA